MIDLRKILSNLFADRTYNDIENFLEEHQLLDAIRKTVSQLNSIINNQVTLMQNALTLPVGHISSNLLVTINKTIFAEKDLEKKAQLENTLGTLCLKLLKEFLTYVKCDRVKLVFQIQYALQDTCSFYNYDFNQLTRFLNIDSTAAYLLSLKNAEHYKSINNTTIVPAYIWKGKPLDKETFIEMFKDQNLIKSRKGLNYLFGDPITKLNIQFDDSKADIILQLFHNLKEKKLLGHCGCKGFYQVLEFHVLDFKENFLKNKKPRERVNALKQSTTKWTTGQGKIDKWLSPF